MEEENVSVEVEESQPTEESLPEEETVASAEDVKQESEEQVDEKGVPLKNRVAEQKRKIRKMSQSEAETALLEESTPSTLTEQEEAVRIVENIAEQKAKKLIEPILARQFLMDNPDAKEMIEDINRVRAKYPELASIDRLDAAYKIAKAERQDEIIRKQVEKGTQEIVNKKEIASQNAIEGTGKSKTPAVSLADQIKGASSLEELEALESKIQ